MSDEARLKPGWKMPDVFPPPRCHPEAIMDGGECIWVGWRGCDGKKYGDIDWPFATPWADAEDFKRLGFRVVAA